MGLGSQPQIWLSQMPVWDTSYITASHQRKVRGKNWPLTAAEFNSVDRQGSMPLPAEAKCNAELC